eukprot:6200841-Amphidinium_carterae.3
MKLDPTRTDVMKAAHVGLPCVFVQHGIGSIFFFAPQFSSAIVSAAYDPAGAAIVRVRVHAQPVLQMVDGQTAIVFALRSEACQLRHKPKQAAVLRVKGRPGDPQSTSAVGSQGERPGLDRLLMLPVEICAGVCNRDD